MPVKQMILTCALAVFGLGAVAEDHVNLWPLYARDGSAHDVIWPLVHVDTVRDHYTASIFDWSPDHFNTHPLFYLDHDKVTIVPLYSGNRNLEKGFLLPLFGWDTYDHTSWLLPFYIAQDYRNFFTLPYSRVHSDTYDAHALFGGLAGQCKYHNDTTSSWLLPLYYADTAGSFYSLPYSHSSGHQGSSQHLFLGGLAGLTHQGNDLSRAWLFPVAGWSDDSFYSLPYCGISGKSRHHVFLGGLGYCHDDTSWLMPLYFANDKAFATPIFGLSGTSHWLLPLYAKTGSDFHSLAFSHFHDQAYHSDIWFSVPALSWGTYDATREHNSTYALLGLGGHLENRPKNTHATWLMPFFYDNEERFISPLYGQNRDGSRYCPIIGYHDQNSTYSVFYSQWQHAQSTRHFIPWALSLYNHTDSGSSSFYSLPLLSTYSHNAESGRTDSYLMLGLAGHHASERENTSSSWLLPFYYHERDRSGNASWMATPLLGGTSGTQSSFRLSPLFDRHADTNFTEVARAADAPSLPQNLNLGTDTTTNRPGVTILRKTQSGWGALGALDAHLVQSDTFVDVFSDRDKQEIKIRRQHHSRSCFNLHQTTCEKTTTFNATTGKRTGTAGKSSNSLLWGVLYRNEETFGNDPTNHTSQSNFLVKLWERSEEKGHVKIDAIPFYTYDSHPDGSSGVSFLWRLYRRETKPGQGENLDIFFIPFSRCDKP